MALLFVDTAMNACSAAVEDGGIVTAHSRAMHRGQAEMLAPFMAQVMAEGGIGFDRLEAVAVTVGPGTFTGLRVGMAAAKGVALARDIQVIGLTTLEIIAAQMADESNDRDILVVIESKRSDFYLQLFDRDGRAKHAPQAMEAANIAAAYGAAGCLVCGDAGGRLRADITEGGSPWPQLWTARECLYPSPQAALKLAAQRLGAGPVKVPEPLYLRPADVSQPKVKRIIEG